MNPTEIAKSYIAAMGKKDLAAIEALFAPDIHFMGPQRSVKSASELMPLLKRLTPILEGTKIVKLFPDGEDVCIVYDYITSTDEGAVTTMEWIHVAGGKIDSIRLLTDHVKWPKVLAELQRRMG